MSAAITVLHVQPIDRGQLRAVAKVRIGGIVLHGIRILDQEDGAPWVAMPAAPIRAKADGSGSGWLPVVDIVHPGLADRVRDAVLQAWREAQQAAPRDEPPVPLPGRGRRAWA